MAGFHAHQRSTLRIRRHDHPVRYLRLKLHFWSVRESDSLPLAWFTSTHFKLAKPRHVGTSKCAAKFEILTTAPLPPSSVSDFTTGTLFTPSGKLGDVSGLYALQSLYVNHHILFIPVLGALPCCTFLCRVFFSTVILLRCLLTLFTLYIALSCCYDDFGTACLCLCPNISTIRLANSSRLPLWSLPASTVSFCSYYMSL